MPENEPKILIPSEKQNPGRVIGHILLTALAIALLVGTLESLIGWLIGWRSYFQFSNGFFIAGCVLGVLGVISVFGRSRARFKTDGRKDRFIDEVNVPEKVKQWLMDIDRGYNALVIFAVSGALMIGLSILVYKLFA